MSEQVEWSKELEDSLFTDDVLEGMDAIAHIEDEERLKMDEPTFVGHFLPLLKSGDSKEWSRAIGSPYFMVDIVNHKGEVVITIPPVINRLTSTPNRDGGYSVAHIAEDAALRAAVSPHLGTRHMNTHLALKVGELAMQTDHRDDWKKVWAHYEEGVLTSDNKVKHAEVPQEAFEVTGMDDL